MFYEELYSELGKLFYHIAAADGRVDRSEKEVLQKTVSSIWEPLEDSKDAFGTDKANMIHFAFDFEEAATSDVDYFVSFSEFYKENRERFSYGLKNNTLRTAEAISGAFRGTNRKEKAILQKLQRLFADSQ